MFITGGLGGGADIIKGGIGGGLNLAKKGVDGAKGAATMAGDVSKGVLEATVKTLGGAAAFQSVFGAKTSTRATLGSKRPSRGWTSIRAARSRR